MPSPQWCTGHVVGVVVVVGVIVVDVEVVGGSVVGGAVVVGQPPGVHASQQLGHCVG
jgi:hypothetical protein